MALAVSGARLWNAGQEMIYSSADQGAVGSRALLVRRWNRSLASREADGKEA
jgi:hypothetical protein